MKNTVAKTFKTIFIVLAAVLLIITAVLYYIDAPVIEEGQEPTVAQKIILLGKEYLAEILLACGASGIGLLGVFVKLIYNSVRKSVTDNQATAGYVLLLEKRQEINEKKIAEQNKLIAVMSKKQDMANNLLMTIFSLSELPLSLREQIHNTQTEYNGLDGTAKIAGEIIETVKNVEPAQEQPVTEKAAVEDKPKENKTEEEAEKSSVPVFV